MVVQHGEIKWSSKVAMRNTALQFAFPNIFVFLPNPLLLFAGTV
jgi:hypothetical protein